MAVKYCVIAGCEEELPEGRRLDECINCRASINMWKRRGVRAVVERRERLAKYDNRMKTLIGPKAVEVKRRKTS